LCLERWSLEIKSGGRNVSKEVLSRICEKKVSKAYGILSVLRAFYDAGTSLQDENVFNPPPKVKSRVALAPKEDYSLPCKGKLFFTVVNRFQQRRKTY
jgi:16S rRNA (adenine1518-N6/adenine1519-N6)-dimethyltransferase